MRLGQLHRWRMEEGGMWRGGARCVARETVDMGQARGWEDGALGKLDRLEMLAAEQWASGANWQAGNLCKLCNLCDLCKLDKLGELDSLGSLESLSICNWRAWGGVGRGPDKEQRKEGSWLTRWGEARG